MYYDVPQAARISATGSQVKRPAEQLTHGGMNPSFLFLQLYHQHIFGKEHPLPLPSNNEHFERTIRQFDFIHPYETHKIGVLYVGPGQVCASQLILTYFNAIWFRQYLISKQFTKMTNAI